MGNAIITNHMMNCIDMHVSTTRIPRPENPSHYDPITTLSFNIDFSPSIFLVNCISALEKVPSDHGFVAPLIYNSACICHMSYINEVLTVICDNSSKFLFNELSNKVNFSITESGTITFTSTSNIALSGGFYCASEYILYYL